MSAADTPAAPQFRIAPYVWLPNVDGIVGPGGPALISNQVLLSPLLVSVGQGSLLVAVDRDGRVTQWNNQTEQTTGLGFEEVRGRRVVALTLMSRATGDPAESEVAS